MGKKTNHTLEIQHLQQVTRQLKSSHMVLCAESMHIYNELMQAIQSLAAKVEESPRPPVSKSSANNKKGRKKKREAENEIVKAKKQKNEVEESRSSEEEDCDESFSEDEKVFYTLKPAPIAKKRVAAAKKAESSSRELATPAPLVIYSSKTLFAGNLSFRIEQSDVVEFFKECGEVVDVRFATDEDGQFKGFGHIEFATAEQAKKAFILNGADLAGRPLRLELARERREKSAQGQSARGFDTFEVADKPALKAAVPAKRPVAAAKKAESSSSEESSEDEPATNATPVVYSSKTLFAGNLSFRIEQSDVVEFFKECGEVVDVRFATDEDGQFKGFGHIEFAAAEQAKKAFEMDGAYLAGRPVRLELARERLNKSVQGQSVRCLDTSEGEDKPATAASPDAFSSKTVFAANLSFRIEQSDVVEFFKECGEVVDVRFATDHDGQFKGFGHIEFAAAEQAKKAFEMNGVYLAGRPVRLELARERREKSAQGFVRLFNPSKGEDKPANAVKPRQPPGDNNRVVCCGRDQSDGGGRCDICDPYYCHNGYSPLC